MYRVYLHEFCKVVTSELLRELDADGVYLHEFCKVVTSVNSVTQYLIGVLT